METRKIGQLDVSVVGIGCNNFGMKIDGDAAVAVVHAALDHGVNFFDTADVYGRRGGSEEMLGRALATRTREEVVIATKFGMAMSDTDESMRGGRAGYVKRAVDASLRRLGVDFIDLYQMHAPDGSTPIDETLGALDDLVRAGKVREIGCSNFDAGQVHAATTAARNLNSAPFASLQNRWSLLERAIETDVVAACERDGLAVLPYFPLASGLLTGKYRAGHTPPPGSRLAFFGERGEAMMDEATMQRVAALESFARSRERSLLELAMSWLAGRTVVASVIAGATTAEQVTANVNAATWRLSADELAAVDEISPVPVPETQA